MTSPPTRTGLLERAAEEAEADADEARRKLDEVHAREVAGLHRTMMVQWSIIAVLVVALVALAGRSLYVELGAEGVTAGTSQPDAR